MSLLWGGGGLAEDLSRIGVLHFPSGGLADFGEYGPGEVGVVDDDHGLHEHVVSLCVFDGESWAVEDHGAESFEFGAVGEGVEACEDFAEFFGCAQRVVAGHGIGDILWAGEDEDSFG